MRRTSSALLLAGVLLLAACGADDVPVSTGGSGGTATTGPTTAVTTVPGEPIPGGPEGLDEARARWEASGIVDYEMTYRYVCFCPETVVAVTVRDGSVVEVDEGEAARRGGSQEAFTVDDLFDRIQAAVDEGAVQVDATYDQDTGRPTRYWIDWDEMMADEESGIEVTDFRLASDDATGTDSTTTPTTDQDGSVVTTGTSLPASHRLVAEAQLTEPWSCGYGFAAVNADRTVALHVLSTTRPPSGTTTVTFPNPDWDGDVLVGAGLLSVDCMDGDVIESPQPAEAWPVVGGTLEVTAPDQGGRTASAVARNLAVETPDGATITFAELRFTSDCWGCAAG